MTWPRSQKVRGTERSGTQVFQVCSILTGLHCLSNGAMFIKSSNCNKVGFLRCLFLLRDSRRLMAVRLLHVINWNWKRDFYYWRKNFENNTDTVTFYHNLKKKSPHSVIPAHEKNQTYSISFNALLKLHCVFTDGYYKIGHEYWASISYLQRKTCKDLSTSFSLPLLTTLPKEGITRTD